MLLVTGTCDLFLSNTIRMHLKLRDTGNIADLIVLEGLSHAKYLMTYDTPETKRYFGSSVSFFDQFLEKKCVFDFYVNENKYVEIVKTNLCFILSKT